MSYYQILFENIFDSNVVIFIFLYSCQGHKITRFMILAGPAVCNTCIHIQQLEYTSVFR